MMISGFRHDADEICGLLGYYAALSGNCIPTCRVKLSVPSSRVEKPKKDFLTVVDGTDSLSRNVGIELPLFGCVISQKSADPIFQVLPLASNLGRTVDFKVLFLTRVRKLLFVIHTLLMIRCSPKEITQRQAIVSTIFNVY
jgi:hypothetical protein